MSSYNAKMLNLRFKGDLTGLIVPPLKSDNYQPANDTPLAKTLAKLTDLTYGSLIPGFDYCDYISCYHLDGYTYLQTAVTAKRTHIEDVCETLQTLKDHLSLFNGDILYRTFNESAVTEEVIYYDNGKFIIAEGRSYKNDNGFVTDSNCPHTYGSTYDPEAKTRIMLSNEESLNLHYHDDADIADWLQPGVLSLAREFDQDIELNLYGKEDGSTQFGDISEPTKPDPAFHFRRDRPKVTIVKSEPTTKEEFQRMLDNAEELPVEQSKAILKVLADDSVTLEGIETLPKNPTEPMDGRFKVDTNESGLVNDMKDYMENLSKVGNDVVHDAIKRVSGVKCVMTKVLDDDMLPQNNNGDKADIVVSRSAVMNRTGLLTRPLVETEWYARKLDVIKKQCKSAEYPSIYAAKLEDFKRACAIRNHTAISYELAMMRECMVAKRLPARYIKKQLDMTMIDLAMHRGLELPTYKDIDFSMHIGFVKKVRYNRTNKPVLVEFRRVIKESLKKPIVW